jgi:hypothetical protein
MLSSVLKSKRAIQVNIEIIKAFVQLRNMMISHKNMKKKIEEMEAKYDEQFQVGVPGPAAVAGRGREAETEDWVLNCKCPNIQPSIVVQYGQCPDATPLLLVAQIPCKELKGLERENLRDHMTDLELIFSMLGEAATTEIARKQDAQGLPENKIAARKGGRIAGGAREKLEKETGAKVVSEENYLTEPESRKRVKCRK